MCCPSGESTGFLDCIAYWYSLPAVFLFEVSQTPLGHRRTWICLKKRLVSSTKVKNRMRTRIRTGHRERTLQKTIETRARTPTTHQTIQLGIRSAARIAAEILGTTEINQIPPETPTTDKVDQQNNRTTRIVRTAILRKRTTKTPMAKSRAVPKRTTGPSNKARSQDLSLVRGPGWRNGPTNCSESVKYRKNSMGLAAETYYP